MAERLAVERIKQIRGKYGLTQQAFARLLGIGEASMVRYENGQVPSKANANLIRAANNPTFMLDCLERDGDQLSQEQRAKTEQIIYSLVSFDEEGKVMNINDIYMLTLQQEVLNEKVAELVADVTKMRRAAQANHDEVRGKVYDDVLKELAHAERQIIRHENKNKVKLAEIRGQINGLARLISSNSSWAKA